MNAAAHTSETSRNAATTVLSCYAATYLHSRRLPTGLQGSREQMIEFPVGRLLSQRGLKRPIFIVLTARESRRRIAANGKRSEDPSRGHCITSADPMIDEFGGGHIDSQSE